MAGGKSAARVTVRVKLRHGLAKGQQGGLQLRRRVATPHWAEEEVVIDNVAAAPLKWPIQQQLPLALLRQS
jgi:hypothetical protein